MKTLTRLARHGFVYLLVSLRRAVHLDIVLDMSTETFIHCLKRFAARRGLPKRFISDNGKTFKAASRFLKEVFKGTHTPEVQMPQLMPILN